MQNNGTSILETAAIYNISALSTTFQQRRILEEHGLDALYSKKRGRPIIGKVSKNKHPEEGSKEALLAEIEGYVWKMPIKKVKSLNSRGEKISERQKAQVIYELGREYPSLNQ